MQSDKIFINILFYVIFKITYDFSCVQNNIHTLHSRVTINFGNASQLVTYLSILKTAHSIDVNIKASHERFTCSTTVPLFTDNGPTKINYK